MTEPDKNILQQQSQANSSEVIASAKVTKRAANYDEYIGISPVLQKYGKPAAQEPSSNQWRRFSEKLNRCIEEELAGTAAPHRLRTWRDRLMAGDSRFAKSAVAVFVVFLLTLILGTAAYLYSHLDHDIKMAVGIAQVDDSRRNDFRG